MCVQKEPYPKEILPKRSYKKKLKVDQLLRIFPDLMVVRQVKGDESCHRIQTEGGETVWQDSVFESSMANLSFNLAGGIFDTRKNAHLRFLPLSTEAKALWKGGNVNPEIVSPENSYSFDETCFGLCFLVRFIHNRTFPFYKFFASQVERDEYAKKVNTATTVKEKEFDAHLVGAFENKKKPVTISPRIKVHHNPCKANYWHFTLDTYRPSDTEPVKPEEKLNNSDKRMFKSLKQDLVQKCTVNAEPGYQLSRACYIKWPFVLFPFLVR